MTSAIGVFSSPPVDASRVPLADGKFRTLPARRREWPNRLAGAACLSIALISPLPHASNLPLVWLFWATVLGAVASLFVVFRVGWIPAHPTGRLLIALGIAFAAFAGFQSLPLAGLRGGLMVEVPGGTVVLRHLSFAPGASLLAAMRLSSYVIFFALAMRIGRDPVNARRAGAVLFWLVAAQALVAILNLKFGGDTGIFFEKIAFSGMATGTFVNRNSLATYLGMGLVLGLCLYTGTAAGGRAPRKARLFPAWAGLVVILAALILTQSRMGVGASLAAAAFVVLRNGRPIRDKATLAAIASGVLLFAGSTGLFARVTELGTNDEHRAALYGQVAKMIYSRPLTGFGLDSFPLVYQMFHAPPVTANFVWDHAHSTYLTLWAEAGIFIGSVPMIAGAIAFVSLIKITKSGLAGRSMARAGAGALVLAALHSLVDFSLEIQANVFLLLGLVALGLGPAQPRKDPHD